ncbi:DivIVA domain-containing protein [bacterium]|nr:DivIVA domain-containing protein [bacterium]MCI0602840.1 DivIVA domain-containing protein [bacterium]
MKISSIDIQRQKFQVKLKGYDQEEVRNFLITVAEQIEELSRENDIFKQEIDRLREILKDYEERDHILKNTLVTAQKNSEAMLANTKKEGDLIVKEAEFKAMKLMEHAQGQVLKIQKDMMDLKLQRKALQDKIQTSIQIMQKILEYQKEEEKSAEKIMYYGKAQEGGPKQS